MVYTMGHVVILLVGTLTRGSYPCVLCEGANMMMSLLLQVMGTELVQELQQFLIERNESVYWTCIGLYHKGARLEEFMEIASIEGVENGSLKKACLRLCV